MESGHVLFMVLANFFYIADSLFDAALHKPCTQSSTHTDEYGPRVAGLAVDGIIDYWTSCTVTVMGDTNPWWQVDLQGMYSVHSVFLRNRDIGGYRLGDLTIRVSGNDGGQGALCAFHEGAIVEHSAELVLCDKIIQGRFVKISKETNFLTLCEVQVVVLDRSSVCQCKGQMCTQLQQGVVLFY